MSANLSEVAIRIDWLLKKVWHGSQTKMARDIGVSQSVISHVVVGRQEPGRKLLSAIASNPLVNSRWLITGEGEPLVAQFTEPGRRALYVATELFEGLPEEHGECLGSMFEVPLCWYRASRYWFKIPADCPLVSVNSLKIATGDLVLFEPDRTGWPVDIKGHPCIVQVDDGRLHLDHVTDHHDKTISTSRTEVARVKILQDGRFARSITLPGEKKCATTDAPKAQVPIIAVGIFRIGGFAIL